MINRTFRKAYQNAGRKRPAARGYAAAGRYAVLSNEQKGKICILAKQAWDIWKDRVGTTDQTEWRRDEQEKVTGKSSLTQCTQRDFLLLVSHFQDLAGDSGRALNTAMRSQTDDRRVAFNKLEAACEEAGVSINYAGAICRTQNKCSLDEANAKQLWHLVFTVRNRRRSARSTTTVDQTPEEPF